MDSISGYTTVCVLQCDERRKVLQVEAKDTQRCFVAKIYQDYRYFSHERKILEKLSGCVGVPTLAGVSETDSHRIVILTDDTGGRDLTTHVTQHHDESINCGRRRNIYSYRRVHEVNQRALSRDG